MPLFSCSLSELTAHPKAAGNVACTGAEMDPPDHVDFDKLLDSTVSGRSSVIYSKVDYSGKKKKKHN